jgi:hypothetical protein
VPRELRESGAVALGLDDRGQPGQPRGAGAGLIDHERGHAAAGQLVGEQGVEQVPIGWADEPGDVHTTRTVLDHDEES